MSTEEQDQIHGRLLRQRSEGRRRLAAISTKLKDAGVSIRQVASLFEDLSTSSLWAGSPVSARMLIENMPAPPALLALLHEAIEEQQKMREVLKQLQDFSE